jgi:phospholipid/cholesterol/gamma-HCH transport system substrate-binding protein
MLRRRRLIGLAVLLAAIAAAWLGIAKPDPFSSTEVVHAMFDHVQGIALVQRDVRVAGVNVGTIGAVRRVGTHAEVDLVLHQRIPVYRDATAALRPHTPFEGTTFVDLDPGTPSAGALGNAPIPVSQTSVFVSAGDVLSTFTAPVRRSFQQIVAQLDVALQRPGQVGLSTAIRNAPALLHQTALVAPALRGPHQTELRTLIPSLSHTVDALAGQDGELRSAVHNVRRTLDAVAADDAVPFDSSLQALPGALGRATTAGRDLVTVLGRARATATALVPTLGAIPPTTKALIPLLGRAGRVFPSVPPVVSEFAQSLRNLGTNGPALARLFATLRSPASLLRHSLVPYFDSPSKLGLPNYVQLMSATAGFTGALSSFVTGNQTPLAKGHALRGTLEGPFTLPLGALNSPIPCSAIAKLNPTAVSVAQELGLCTP